ncbi:hypothetical protein H5397_15705 [Propioniciclava sp. MC1683]|uniref:hypothetical protein n=1 Tax=Propioniciclava sp. MC1683 TaxID=2760309 RepID=UPI001600D991|nr:hypothetical protein [Propioniciclava sp. MC1683]MBB1502848.1 hypothetical protein [Propioniciclava sp. MC1683]
MRRTTPPTPRRAAIPDARVGWPGARPLALVGAVAWMEGVLRVGTGEHLLDGAVVLPLLLGVAPALLVHLVSTLAGPRVRTLLVGFGLAFLAVLYSSQYVYFQIFRTVHSAYSAANAGQVAEFAADIGATVVEHAAALALILVVPTLLVVLVSRAAPTPVPTWRHRALVLLVAAVAQGVSLTVITVGDREPNSPWDLYHRSTYPVASVQQLGLITTMRLDVARTLVGFEPADPGVPPALDPVPSPTPIAPEGAASSAPPSAGPTPVAREPHVLPIDFEALAADAPNSRLQGAHTWFGQRAPSYRNDHTGRFAGYSLVLATAEGYSHHAIDPEPTWATPTRGSATG